MQRGGGGSGGGGGGRFSPAGGRMVLPNPADKRRVRKKDIVLPPERMTEDVAPRKPQSAAEAAEIDQ